MASLIGSIFSVTGDNSLDQSIAYTSAAGAAATAQTYFSAALVAVTPEVKRLFSDYSIQILMGHEQLNDLMLKKGWVKPYDEVTEQLQTASEQSGQVLNALQQQQ